MYILRPFRPGDEAGVIAVLDDTFELTCRYNVDRLGGDQP